jgi:hypothetical protein
MRDGTRSPALWLGGLAAGGAIGGHYLAYWFASTDAVPRERLLEETGHRYFGWCAAIALGLVMAALASFFRSRFRTAGRGRTPARLALHLAPRLVPLQIGTCLSLEAGERSLVAGKGLEGIGGLVGEPHVMVAVAIQAVVALCAAGILAVLASVVDRVARLTGGPRPRRARSVPAILPRIQVAPVPAVAVLSGTISHRGPPNTR